MVKGDERRGLETGKRRSSVVQSSVSNRQTGKWKMGDGK